MGRRPKWAHAGATLAALCLVGALGPAPVRAAAPEADLSLTFTHYPEPGVGLLQLIYTVHVSNAGPSTATSLKVVNTLPAGAVFDSAGGVGWDCGSPAGGVVTCTYPSLAAGANASFLGIAVITPAQGGMLSDTASVTAIESDPVPSNNTATESVVVNRAPPVSFYTTTPCRLVDTRDPVAPLGGPALGANGSRIFLVNTACGLPADARAVAVNVTVVDGTDVGDLRVYPTGTDLPNASTINFVAGQVRANSAVIPLITGGISVQSDMPSGSTGTVHLLLDVSGYFK